MRWPAWHPNPEPWIASESIHALPKLAEAGVIADYLPEQLSAEDVAAIVTAAVEQVPGRGGTGRSGVASG